MKLKELTKEQRVMIEADELGKELLISFGEYDFAHKGVSKSCQYLKLTKEQIDNHILVKVHENYTKLIQAEIKRTIKRIDDEIEFLEYCQGEMDRNPDILIHMNTDIFRRKNNLWEQKQLYELMEQLE